MVGIEQGRRQAAAGGGWRRRRLLHLQQQLTQYLGAPISSNHAQARSACGTSSAGCLQTSIALLRRG